MLSRTARFAAALTLLQSSLLLGSTPAHRSRLLACGDSGEHQCCVDLGNCLSGYIYCCWFSSSGGNDPHACSCVAES
jgi:hypothetical protein